MHHNSASQIIAHTVQQGLKNEVAVIIPLDADHMYGVVLVLPGSLGVSDGGSTLSIGLSVEGKADPDEVHHNSNDLHAA
jgi:hypothetical protein